MDLILIKREVKMSNKKWQIEVEGKQCVIDVHLGSFTGGGCLTLNGEEINKWGASFSGLPSRIKFEVKGKKAEIKSKGFLSVTPILYVDGKEVK
jgi:hypothetical protein